jgi:antitoxin Phd
METWQLQEAKSKFSQLVDSAIQGNTQIVTKRGVEAVAIISISALNKLKKDNQTQSLLSALMSAPHNNIDLTRSDEPTRDIEL